MSLGCEKRAIQNPLIEYVMEAGRDYVSLDDALRLRGGNTCFVFKELAINQVGAFRYISLNIGLKLDDKNGAR